MPHTKEIKNVYLDVGGTIFKTSKSTLSKSAFFEAMFKEEWKEKGDTQENAIFIDRDPDNFKQVLGWLRDPQSFIDKDVLYEFEFFQIPFESTHKEPREYSQKVEHVFPDENSKKMHSLLSRALTQYDYFHNDRSTPAGVFRLVINNAARTRSINESIIPCASVTTENQVNINSGHFSIPIHRGGDIVQNIWIHVKFRYKNKDYIDPHLRYKLIENLYIKTDFGILTEKLSGIDMYMYDQINKSSSKYQYDIKMDVATGIITYKVPFTEINILASCFTSLYVILDLEKIEDIDIEEIKYNMSQLYLDTPVRQRGISPYPQACKFNDLSPDDASLQPIINYRSFQDEVKCIDHINGTYEAKFRISLITPSRRLYFKVSPVEDSFTTIPVKSIEIIGNNVSIFKVSERMILEQMTSTDIYPQDNVYCWDFSPSYLSLDTRDLDVNICIAITFYDSTFKDISPDQNFELRFLSEHYNIREYKNGIVKNIWDFDELYEEFIKHKYV